MGGLVRPAYLFPFWNPDLLPSLACIQTVKLKCFSVSGMGDTEARRLG